jgi:hypothetical protein
MWWHCAGRNEELTSIKKQSFNSLRRRRTFTLPAGQTIHLRLPHTKEQPFQEKIHLRAKRVHVSVCAVFVFRQNHFVTTCKKITWLHGNFWGELIENDWARDAKAQNQFTTIYSLKALTTKSPTFKKYSPALSLEIFKIVCAPLIFPRITIFPSAS